MTAGELRHITRRHGRRAAVDDISLSVGVGEIVGLIGPNGAGKTTLLRILAGLLRPSAGSAHMAAPLAYFGGEHTLPPDVSARRWLSLWSKNLDCASSRRLSVLSRGTRQQVGLRATLGRAGTRLLLLDEPWEGLDPDASRWLSRALIAKRENGAGVLVSSHRIHDLADVCDRCVFLVNGRLGASEVRCSELSDRVSVLFETLDRAKERA